MKSSKMNMLVICVGCSIFMFEAIDTYKFSFMGVPALLALIVFFISLMYFMESWFYYGGGLFTGIVILIPFITALCQGSRHIAAFIFDGILSLFLCGYFGYKVYKRIQSQV